MNDALSAFLASMEAAGVVPVQPIASALGSGDLVRFRADGDKPSRKNGWAVLHLGDFPAGAFGHYRLGIRSTWREGATRALSPAERLSIKRQIAEAEARRRDEMVAASAAAKTLWRAARPASCDHSYLRRKGLRPFGVRQAGADLLVPMVDAEFHLWNVQRIGADGFKRFLKGGRTTGLFWPHGTYLDNGRPAVGPLVIGEGFATLARIHDATGYGVAAAMSAGNLTTVALAMRRTFTTREFIIAADHDGHLPRNIGLEAAAAAAERVGAVVAVPIAGDAPTDSAGRGVDFADIPAANVAYLVERARTARR